MQLLLRVQGGGKRGRPAQNADVDEDAGTHKRIIPFHGEIRPHDKDPAQVLNGIAIKAIDISHFPLARNSNISQKLLKHFTVVKQTLNPPIKFNYLVHNLYI